MVPERVDNKSPGPLLPVRAPWGAQSRPTLNGPIPVLHSHHFTTLYCQLADDAEIVDGRALLADAAEETFFPGLRKYYGEFVVTKA